MKWPGPKLQPGERLVGRRPAPLTGRQWVFGAAAAAAVAATILAIMLWLGPPEKAIFAMTYAAFGGIYVLVQLSGRHMWRLAVTDQRLLVRRTAFWRAPREVRLDEIENVVTGSGPLHCIMERPADQEAIMRA